MCPCQSGRTIARLPRRASRWHLACRMERSRFGTLIASSVARPFEWLTTRFTDRSFSPDGRFLAVCGSASATAVVRDIARSQEVALALATPFAPSLFFGRNDVGREHSGLRDQPLEHFHGQKLATLPGHRWEIIQTAFSPDGKLLVSVAPSTTPRGFGTWLPDGKSPSCKATNQALRGGFLSRRQDDRHWQHGRDRQAVERRHRPAIADPAGIQSGPRLAPVLPDVLCWRRAGLTSNARQRTVELWRAPSFSEIDTAEKVQSLVQ